MAARMLRRLSAAALLVGASFGAATSAYARPKPGMPGVRPTPARRSFNLFAGAPESDYRPNRVQCGVINNGTACVDPTGSPVNENGFWPAGSPDNYVYNSGLQIAGFIPGTPTAAFPWPGDTVGAFFFDPIGNQHHGEGVTNIYDAKNADDVANWPTAGYVQDTSLFAPILIGRATASQEDLWYRYWDGNTSLATGRTHTMGLLVDQRFLAWNYPSGNNDILYTLVRFINITSGQRSDYDNLADYGYSASDIDDIFAIAQHYRSTSQSFYNVTMPDSGFWWTNLYASYATDADEGDATRNYTMGDLIFNTVVNYKADFFEPTWQLPPSIFAAPFLAGPGMYGIKYLQTPGNLGIAIAGNTTNPSSGPLFPDAVGVSQLWRHLSGNLITADGVSCDIPGGNAAAQTRRQCYWVTTPADTRMYGASGPFSIAPGHAAQTAVALVFAASVAKLPAATPGVAGNAQLPAMDLTNSPLCASAGGDCIGSATGLPATTENGEIYAVDGARLWANQDTVKEIDRVMGFDNYTADVNGNSEVDQAEVETVPRSLLDKEKVAQTVFDNRFLLPFAPEVPPFYLVPGDGQVTIAWGKSASETTGNAFFTVASQPLVTCPGGVGMCPNPLYDPNFRQFDTEGYRIWRGRTSSDMRVIAQFDYSGTTMTDYTAEFYDEATYSNQCAPELGVTTSCPSTYSLATDGATYIADTPPEIPLSGVVRQIPPGGRVELADGTIFNVNVDTAVTGGASGYPGLSDTGVPFAYVDRSLVDGVRYFYAVTAFSINSLKSGPSSLESQLAPKSVTPRAASTNAQAAVIVTGAFGDDGVQLNTAGGWPAIDANNGTLNGPVPPENGGNFKFLADVAEALPPGNLTAHIDSVSWGYAGGIGIQAPNMYVTVTSDTVTLHLAFALPVSAYSDPVGSKTVVSYSAPLGPYDSTRSAQLGLPAAFARANRMPVEFDDTLTPISMQSFGVGMVAGRYASFVGKDQPSHYLSHSRWFDEGGSEPADPTIDFNPSHSHDAGQLTGVDSIWAPQAERQPTETAPASAAYAQVDKYLRYVNYADATWYPADFVVTWGNNGHVTVRDETHHVDLPYDTLQAVGWGFVNVGDVVASGVSLGALQDNLGPAALNLLAYQDLYSTFPTCAYIWGVPCIRMADSTMLQPVDFNNDGVADGQGFMLVVNGEPFMFTMTSLPTSGTKWHLRAMGGEGMSATCTPAIPATPVGTSDNATNQWLTPATDCSGYSWSPANSVRPALAPGLNLSIKVTQAFSIATAAGDLSNIHTVPDPYYVTNSLEQTVNTKILRFVNLPNQAIIRIYSSSGILVRIITHNDPGGGGEEVWDLRNRNNQFVASGVYFYHVEAADGQTKVGRFTVVSYAQ